MKIKRSDLYTLVLVIAQWTLFTRFVSYLTSGNLLWTLKAKTAFSYILIALFIFSFLIMFGNLSKLVSLTQDLSDKESNSIIFQVGRATVGLLLLFVFTIIVSSLANTSLAS